MKKNVFSVIAAIPELLFKLDHKSENNFHLCSKKDYNSIKNGERSKLCLAPRKLEYSSLPA